MNVLGSVVCIGPSGSFCSSTVKVFVLRQLIHGNIATLGFVCIRNFLNFLERQCISICGSGVGYTPIGKTCNGWTSRMLHSPKNFYSWYATLVLFQIHFEYIKDINICGDFFG